MNAHENGGVAPRGTTPSAETSAARVNLGRKLKSLREGDLAVLEAVPMGTPTIPILREILFEGDSAGVFELRRRAVQALATSQRHWDELLVVQGALQFLFGKPPGAQWIDQGNRETLRGDCASMSLVSRREANADITLARNSDVPRERLPYCV